MPEDQNCKLPQTPKNTNKKKKKKKKKKKDTASNTPPEDAEKRQTDLSKLRATAKKDGEWLAGSGRRSKKHPKGSPANKSSGSVAPAQGYVSELSAQARESLRWEGVLDDPQAEEKRLELYRANRRQRYIAHREATSKETQDTLRHTFPKEDKEKKASGQQKSVSSSLHLSAD